MASIGEVNKDEASTVCVASIVEASIGEVNIGVANKGEANTVLASKGCLLAYNRLSHYCNHGKDPLRHPIRPFRGDPILVLGHDHRNT